MVQAENYQRILEEVRAFKAELIAVSKKKSIEDIKNLANLGQKSFGENYVQELVQKNNQVSNLDWHFIGHLQSNKVKMLMPYVKLIQSVDSRKLLNEINKEAAKAGIVQDCLLEVFIASEETKSGFAADEIEILLNAEEPAALRNVAIRGLMGMATFTEDNELIRSEFKKLYNLFEKYKGPSFNILSMGMTSDYKIALEEGSTMVRIGSAIFGER